MKAPLLNPVLTGIATRYMASLPTVGKRIAPVVNSPLPAAAYYVYDNSSFTDIPRNIQRAPGSGFKRGTPKLSEDTFLCKDYGFEEPIDKMELQMYASFFAADRAGMERAIRVVAMNHEIRVHDLAATASQTASPSVKWNAASGTTIKADIEAGKNAIRASIGVLPNLLTLPYNVYTAIRDSAEMKGYLRSADGVVTKAQMEAILEVEIQVSGDLVNNANEGQAASLGDIWSDEAFLSYSIASSDLKSLNFARTYNWTAAAGSGAAGISTFTYDQDEIDSRIVRARQFTDEKIAANGAGYYFSNVLS